MNWLYFGYVIEKNSNEIRYLNNIWNEIHIPHFINSKVIGKVKSGSSMCFTMDYGWGHCLVSICMVFMNETLSSILRCKMLPFFHIQFFFFAWNWAPNGDEYAYCILCMLFHTLDVISVKNNARIQMGAESAKITHQQLNEKKKDYLIFVNAESVGFMVKHFHYINI